MEIVPLILLFLVFWTSVLLIIADFVYFLVKGKQWLALSFRAFEFIVIIAPFVTVLNSEIDLTNQCCGPTAGFSPGHRISLFVLIMLILGAYFYCSYRKKIAAPIPELIFNALILAGTVLNIFVNIQLNNWLAGPMCLLFIMVLMKNHKLALAHLTTWRGGSRIARFCRYILLSRPLTKYPVLLILCLPLLIVLTGLLMLFGQRPDALVRAFTDTYKQGFSQLNDQCNGVVCPSSGHFLCTIATKGHGKLVRPIRSGVRAGVLITCNRQLLISNAFEELLEQKTPAFHRIVRNNYNRIGRSIHRHYGWFNYKWIADLIYILMKPLEWLFLLTLYICDRTPENRIAQQYMHRSDREKIQQGLQD